MMSKRNALFPIVKESITFDTLWQQATAHIEQLSGAVWSNTGEQDPGVTLLQAAAWNVSDLSYRHTLPLNDLLTAEGQETLFPVEFGPQQMLTCSPITVDDYRRALLDMHSSDIDPDAPEPGFLFSDVQLIREPESVQQCLWYDQEQRAYYYNPPGQDKTNSDRYLSLTLRGNYWLYLQPDRYTQSWKNRSAASEYLHTFFAEHRNIGEQISNIIWLNPTAFSPHLTVELSDDVSNPAAVVAAIYRTLEQGLTPTFQRYTAEQLRQQHDNEVIYQGPWLQHGWIPALSASQISEQGKTFSLAPLVEPLLRIEGVSAISQLSVPNLPAYITPLAEEKWSWRISKHYYPQLWGADPLTLLSSADSPLTLIVKGGIRVKLTREAIAAALNHTVLVTDKPVTLPAGKRRNLAAYTPVTERLPACYHTLETPAAEDTRARQLFQFLLPVDQQLADSAAELNALPELLAFTGRDNHPQIRGTQWPYTKESAAQAVHQSYSAQLIQQKKDEVSLFTEKEKINEASFARELDFISYLLSYFGTDRAARPMTLDYADFLRTQHGFLAQQPVLGYDRINMGSGSVSALQKRLAARIGLGGECFQASPDLSKLPFYLVEHRQFIATHTYRKYLTSIPSKYKKYFYLAIDHAQSVITRMATGTLSYLYVKDENSATESIIAVTNTGRESNYGLFLAYNDQLTYENINELFKKVYAGQVYWSLSDKANKSWLQDMDYQLNYAADQGNLAENQRLLVSNAQSPFPSMVVVGDEIALRLRRPEDSRVKSKRGRTLTGDGTALYLKAIIKKVNQIEGTLLIEKAANASNDFPAAENAWRYMWNFTQSHYATTDRFSFVVSLIQNRKLIEGQGIDPEKLNQWLQQTILSEFPAHLSLISHWLDEDSFHNFALIYSRWQQNGARLDEDGYRIMEMLTLGHQPALRLGIGTMRIASPAEHREATGANGDEFNASVINKNELFYVPQHFAEPDAETQ